MKRDQTFHEHLIPLLVEGIGAEKYLEFGTYLNETISKVKCKQRYGVDLNPQRIDGVDFFAMSTSDFIDLHAAEFGPFDFVFIDADHNATSVANDFWGILPHVVDEGLIVLHDTNPELDGDTDPSFCGDAWKFAQVIDLTHETVTLPYHPGLTIIRKREKWGPIK